MARSPIPMASTRGLAAQRARLSLLRKMPALRHAPGFFNRVFLCNMLSKRPSRNDAAVPDVRVGLCRRLPTGIQTNYQSPRQLSANELLRTPTKTQLKAQTPSKLLLQRSELRTSAASVREGGLRACKSAVKHGNSTISSPVMKPCGFLTLSQSGVKPKRW